MVAGVGTDAGEVEGSAESPDVPLHAVANSTTASEAGVLSRPIARIIRVISPPWVDLRQRAAGDPSERRIERRRAARPCRQPRYLSMCSRDRRLCVPACRRVCPCMPWTIRPVFATGRKVSAMYYNTLAAPALSLAPELVHAGEGIGIVGLKPGPVAQICAGRVI